MKPNHCPFVKFLLLVCVLGASKVSIAQSQVSEPAATHYINGAIWTGKQGAADASVMSVQDGRIVYIGNTSPAANKNEKVVDLKGRFVVPGLIDNHVHFIEGGSGLAAVQLRDAATPEEFSKRIVDYAKTLKSGQWVLYGNWDHELWGGELPNKAWIDAQTPDNPVFVMRLDGHMGFSNSVALKLAGINADSTQPEGGEIVRNKMGEPTGVLKDTGMNPIFAAIPKPSNADLLKSIEAAQNHALKLGLTKVHVMTAYPGEGDIYDAFQLADQKGLLKMRIAVYTPIEHWKKEIAAGPGNKYSSDLLSWNGFKGLTDGALGSTTAWFYDPYLDAPDTNGFPLIAAEQLREMVVDANAADVKLAIHAIGDQAIDMVIKVMQQAAGDQIKTRRYRIEHFQHPSAAGIRAAAQGGIIASMQPYHAIDDGRWAEKRIGPERIKTTYAFKSVLDAGGILSFGSDWPVAPLAPLAGIYAAVTRRTIDGANPNGWQPQEKISVEQALHAYTVANAYAAFEEDVAGTLEVGKRADFVVLGEDLRKADQTKIPDVTIEMTVVGGNVAYRLNQ